jgi:hypothetical protein
MQATHCNFAIAMGVKDKEKLALPETFIEIVDSVFPGMTNIVYDNGDYGGKVMIFYKGSSIINITTSPEFSKFFVNIVDAPSAKEKIYELIEGIIAKHFGNGFTSGDARDMLF